MFIPTARRALLMAVGLLVAGFALAACGGDDNGGGGGGGGGGKSGSVALLLPESHTARYEAQDRPLFEKKMKELCADCDVLYSNAGDRDPGQAAEGARRQL